MNYLSHFYFDRKQVNPQFTLGAAFPDLTRTYNRKLRASSSIRLKSKELPSNLVQLQQGIDRHHYLDSKFHNSDFFHTYTKKFTKLLHASEFETLDKNIYFLAHIVLEILLDRKILEDHKGLAEMYYSQLNSIDNQLITNYFIYRNWEKDLTGFLELYDKFLEKEFIFKYKSDILVSEVINSLHKRVFNTEIEKTDLNKIAICIPKLHFLLKDIDLEGVLI